MVAVAPGGPEVGGACVASGGCEPAVAAPFSSPPQPLVSDNRESLLSFLFNISNKDRFL